jgi:hypothetical protein
MDKKQWSLMLQICFASDELARICTGLGIAMSGSKEDRANRIVSAARSEADLLSLFSIENLKQTSEAEGLPASGNKMQMIEGMYESYMQRHGSKRSKRVSEKKQSVMRVPGSKEPMLRDIVDLLNELHVDSASIHSEDYAHSLIVEHLRNNLGRECVGKEIKLGGCIACDIDIEILRQYGIEVKYSRSILKTTSGSASEVQRMLGQLVLYIRHYASPERVILVIAGPVSSDQAIVIQEIKEIVQDLGVNLIVYE